MSDTTDSKYDELARECAAELTVLGHADGVDRDVMAAIVCKHLDRAVAAEQSRCRLIAKAEEQSFRARAKQEWDHEKFDRETYLQLKSAADAALVIAEKIGKEPKDGR